MAFYDPTVFDVHVLLVDPDLNALFETTSLLQLNSYRVTPVYDPSAASSILSSSDGNATYNLVMVDVNISHLHGFKFLHQAISMDLPVIVMASIASPTLANCAIEDGAFLFMQKPISSDELKYTWQHLWREISRKNKQKQNTTTNNFDVDTTVESVTMNENMSTNMATNVPIGECVGLMPKLCTEWTPDLHKKFMEAVEQLGEGRCFPKDILEQMNVPGLKRMQVASHLQKFRRGWQQNPNWKKGCGPNISKPELPPKDIVQLATTNINVDERNSVQQQEHGTIWDNIGTPSNNMNENAISGLNMVGVQPELDLDGGDDGLVANNVNLNVFDYDHFINGQNSDFDASIDEADFWSSWFADDVGEN